MLVLDSEMGFLLSYIHLHQTQIEVLAVRSNLIGVPGSPLSKRGVNSAGKLGETEERGAWVA